LTEEIMATTTNEAPQEKRSLFDSVIISTPVMLTVIATFILGRSTSEMTQAQYQRALASQNQSKVGDQWAFFQAKRIRGTTFEATADLLLAQKAELFTAETLVEAAQDLREVMNATPSSPESEAKIKALTAKLDQSLKQIKAAVNPPTEGWKGKRITLTPENVKAAFDALQTYPLTKAETSDLAIDADQLALLNAVLDDIRKFKPEKDIAPKTLAIKPETLEQAMERAKAVSAKVAERGKAIDRVLEEFDALVAQQVALGREFQRIAAADAALKKSDARARAQQVSTRLVTDYKAARYAFDARRYEDDARSNQEAAYLYDVQVLQSSARSDKHLKRSFLFMIAMLVAQVGVTIASMAMMLKYRLPVWAIAAFAGILAISFGVAVFVEFAPLIELM
jgi:Domain of unknown function (DUF4337)